MIHHITIRLVGVAASIFASEKRYKEYGADDATRRRITQAVFGAAVVSRGERGQECFSFGDPKDDEARAHIVPGQKWHTCNHRDGVKAARPRVLAHVDAKYLWSRFCSPGKQVFICQTMCREK